MFFYVEPEVAGGLGPNSELRRDNGRLEVVHLDYQFDGWLGDALLETTPCFIVTEAARSLIETASLSGAVLSDVEVTRSELFEDIYGDMKLPHFWRLNVVGQPRVDDFAMSSDLRLVVSERALVVLRKAGIEHATIEPAGRYVR